MKKLKITKKQEGEMQKFFFNVDYEKLQKPNERSKKMETEKGLNIILLALIVSIITSIVVWYVAPKPEIPEESTVFVQQGAKEVPTSEAVQQIINLIENPPIQQ